MTINCPTTAKARQQNRIFETNTQDPIFELVRER